MPAAFLRFLWIHSLLLICPWMPASGATAQPPTHTRPNVVVIMTDDQGYGDFGATGNTVFETPRIDQLSRQSVTFETFYVCPVCSPTRASLMTGRYHMRTRCIDTWLGRSMMDPEEVTIAEVLGGAGYATGIFGKWHLGDCYPMRPMDQGFQESLVHRGGGLAQPSEPRENARRYTDPILFHNGEQVQTQGYCTDVYFDAACQFIGASLAEGRNFFTYLPTNAPHGPFHDVPENLRRHYLEVNSESEGLEKLIVGDLNPRRRRMEIETLARVGAMITNVDQNVGRLLDHLESLEALDNTLVFFLVDNGPNTRRYVGPFRGSKSTVFEGGIRSPLWVHWPARLEAGTRIAHPAAHIDLMPTILEACGVAVPDGLKLDGRSLLPLMQDSQADWPDRTITIQAHRGNAPQRYHNFMIRDSRWKLLHPSGFGKETFSGTPRFELYDLQNDPGETRNLIDSQLQVAQRLKQAYDEWFQDVSSTRPDNYAPPRIHIGSPHETTTVLTRQDWRNGTWAPRSVGTWKLFVESAGDYDVRLLFDASDTEETAVLSFADRERRVAVPAGADACLMPGVKLPAGELSLQATLRDGEEVRGAYQVIIEPAQDHANSATDDANTSD